MLSFLSSLKWDFGRAVVCIGALLRTLTVEASDLQECVRQFTQVGSHIILADAETEATRRRIWQIFEADVSERLSSLDSETREKTLNVMGKIEWVSNLGPMGRVSFGEPIQFQMRESTKGRVTSTITLRHELEHVIETIQRNKNKRHTEIVDRLDPRRFTSRSERRAFTGEYRFVKKIIAETSSDQIRKILVEESGLPRNLHQDFDVLLQSIQVTHEGNFFFRNRGPEGDPLLSAFEDAGDFRVAEIKAATKSLNSYLHSQLQGYDASLASEAPGKAATWIAYTILASGTSYGAFRLFSELFAEELKMIEVEKTPPPPNAK